MSIFSHISIWLDGSCSLPGLKVARSKACALGFTTKNHGESPQTVSHSWGWIRQEIRPLAGGILLRAIPGGDELLPGVYEYCPSTQLVSPIPRRPFQPDPRNPEFVY